MTTDTTGPHPIRATKPILAEVRRINRGEVRSLLLDRGSTPGWRVIKECLRQGISLEIGKLDGAAEQKRKTIWSWVHRWAHKYPNLKLVRCAVTNPDTVIVYFQPFLE